MTELAQPLPARPALTASRPGLARAFYIAEVALMSVFVLAGFLVLPLGDLLLFGGLFAAMLVLWFLPVILAMIFDRVTIGRVHRVYWIGSAAMLIAFTRVALMESEAWLRIGRPMIEAFL